MPNLMPVQAKIEGAKSDILGDSRAEELVVWILEKESSLGSDFEEIRFGATLRAKGMKAA